MRVFFGRIQLFGGHLFPGQQLFYHGRGDGHILEYPGGPGLPDGEFAPPFPAGAAEALLPLDDPAAADRALTEAALGGLYDPGVQQRRVCLHDAADGLQHGFRQLGEVRLPGLDLLLDHPPIGGEVRLFQVVRQDPVQLPAQLGGYQPFSVLRQESPGHQIVDDGGPGGGGADGAVFALFVLVLFQEQRLDLRVLHIFGDSGHVLVEADLGVVGGRLGLLFGDGHIMDPSGIGPLRQVRQGGGRVGLQFREDGPVSGGSDDRGEGLNLSRALHRTAEAGLYFLRRGQKLGQIVFAHRQIYVFLRLRHPGEILRLVCWNDGVMGGDALGVEGPGSDLCVQLPGGIVDVGADCCHGFWRLLEVFIPEILAVRAVIGDGVVPFPETLGDVHDGLRIIAPFVSAVGLELHQIEGQGRLFFGGFLCDPDAVKGPSFQGLADAFRNVLLQQLSLGEPGVVLVQLYLNGNGHSLDLHGSGHRVIELFYMVLDLVIPVHHQTQSGRLDPADGEQGPPVFQGVEPGHIHAHHQVGDGAGMGRPAVRLPETVVLHVPQGLLQGLLCGVGGVQPVDRPGIMKPAEDLVDQILPLVVRVSRVDHGVRLRKQLSDHGELFLLAGPRLLCPVLKVDGQSLQPPLLIGGVIVLRLLQGQNVAVGPGDGPVPFIDRIPPAGRSGQRVGDGPAQTGFLRKNQAHKNILQIRKVYIMLFPKRPQGTAARSQDGSR